MKMIINENRNSLKIRGFLCIYDAIYSILGLKAFW